jgi:hypothetical protein
MSSATHSLALRQSVIPAPRTILHLMIGGLASLGFYEAWANVLAPIVSGHALEPPELIKSLFQHQLGVTVPDIAARALHYATGILFYPLGYWFLTRFVKSFGRPTDGWIWGVITYFIALGVFAPLAGQPFLLHPFAALSLMSLVGHAVHGAIAAEIFEKYEADRR